VDAEGASTPTPPTASWYRPACSPTRARTYPPIGPDVPERTDDVARVGAELRFALARSLTIEIPAESLVVDSDLPGQDREMTGARPRSPQLAAPALALSNPMATARINKARSRA
jgi:hypothetical protein